MIFFRIDNLGMPFNCFIEDHPSGGEPTEAQIVFSGWIPGRGASDKEPGSTAPIAFCKRGELKWHIYVKTAAWPQKIRKASATRGARNTSKNCAARLKRKFAMKKLRQWNIPAPAGAFRHTPSISASRVECYNFRLKLPSTNKNPNGSFSRFFEAARG